MSAQDIPFGKVPPEILSQFALSRTGARRREVVIGPDIGVDAAAVDVDGDILVLSTDPITGAGNNAGWLAVHVACNDIAVHGARPVALLVTLLLPSESATAHLDRLTADIDRAARDVDVAIVGGHTEVSSAVTRPVAVLTAIGRVERSKLIQPAAARAGDDVVLVGSAAIEGTAILASDFADELRPAVGADMVERAQGFWSDVSVVNAALMAAEIGAVAMHDCTEGGIIAAVHEFAAATGLGVRLVVESIHRREETDVIASHFSVDPLALVSSGALLVAARRELDIASRLRDAGFQAARIGEFTATGRRLLLRGKSIPLVPPARDELWRLLEERAGI